MKSDIYQTVTDSIVSLLEQDLAPWRQPWTANKSIDASMPFNAATGRHYSGINVPILWAQAQEIGFSTNAWLTFKQALDLGGHVRKGEKGQMVVFWKFLDRTSTDEHGEETSKSIPMARAYWVFNVEQCDGIESSKAGEIPQPVEPDSVIQWCQRIGADIRHGGNRAYFVPTFDHIQLPRPEQFGSREHYHATALHELTHWTGHSSRLDRKFGARFGDDAYAFEELCAELGSAFLCASIGIPNAPLADHAAYLAHWLKILKNDKRAIFTAASQAQKAASYCLQATADKAQLAA